MEDEDTFKIWIGAAISVVGFGICWGATAYCVGGLDNAAKFGDSFGAINSVFSSLAAAGAVYAVILQRKELRDSRKAAEASAKAQADLVKLQAGVTIHSDWSKERDLLREKQKELRQRQMVLQSRLKIGNYRADEIENVEAEIEWLRSSIKEGDRELKGTFDRLMEARARVHKYLEESDV